MRDSQGTREARSTTRRSRIIDQVCVFSDQNFLYSWQYDNQGLRLAQLRFYPIETTAIGGAC